MPAAEIKFEVMNGISHVILGRPDSGNAINASMAKSLLEAAFECDRRPDIRAVLLDGAGDNFCFGGDIKEFRSAGSGLPEKIREIVTPFHMAIAMFQRMSAPVVTVIRGTAAGGGLGLALASDFTLAAESASFKTAYTALSLCGDGAVTYMLPRLVGMRKAQELLLLNKRINAYEALALGLISRVHTESDLEQEAWKLARTLADSPPLAMRACKNLLLASTSSTLEQQLSSEADWMVALARSTDAQEAVRNFPQNSPQKFIGR